MFEANQCNALQFLQGGGISHYGFAAVEMVFFLLKAPKLMPYIKLWEEGQLLPTSKPASNDNEDSISASSKSKSRIGRRKRLLLLSWAVMGLIMLSSVVDHFLYLFKHILDLDNPDREDMTFGK